MRILLLLALLITLSAPLQARVCKVAIAPAMDTIPRNTAFLLEFCDCPFDAPAMLDRDTPAFLTSPQGDTVHLRPTISDHALIQQTLLTPARLLKPGHRYALHIPGLLDRPEVDYPQGLTWVASDTQIESLVGFKTQPTCPMSMEGLVGDQKHIVAMIDFEPLEQAIYWVRVQTENDWTKDTHTWIVPLAPKQTRISIGWPLRDCGPGTDLQAGEDYRFTLTLYGLDGAQGRTSDPLKFSYH